MSSEDNLEEGREVVYLAMLARTLPRIIARQRALAYASELGESFRPVARTWFVRITYGLSFAYVAADVSLRAKACCEKDTHNTPKDMAYTIFDGLLFHGIASMALPAITIHKIVHTLTDLTQKLPKTSKLHKYPKLLAFLPSILGLSSIPLIVSPIDHGTEYIMDHSIRKAYLDSLPPISH